MPTSNRTSARKDSRHDLRSASPAPAEDIGAPVLRADLIDYGQAVELLAGVDVVVHLANIPAPDIHTPVTTFTDNPR